ncbi:hypothetical protein ABUW04_02035 [Streptacidiphilus sp. N1-10]|uniref:Uncharacterized protein n=1 Tax=Streptacidiphilus jeojiensis TaxID=3229225 RepID=A0ABV6XFJ1_9ACTN
MSFGALARPAIDGSRFFLVDYLPTFAAGLLLTVLVWAGAPGPHLDFDRAWHTAADLGIGELTLAATALLLAAMLGRPLQLAVVRLLEGRWPGVLRPLRRLSCSRQQKLRRSLAAAAALPDTNVDISPARTQAIGAAGARLRRRFPPEGLELPTALGNALAAMEATAGDAYGYDAVTAWPRLYPVLGDRMRAIVDDQRNSLDAAARLSATMAATALAAAALLARSHWWLLLAAVPLVISRVAYLGAVQAALAYGRAVESAFDLHRFDLLTALHLPLPADTAAERRTAAQLSDAWLQGVEFDTQYRHG